jgi:putative FmdB family regulatory protein
MPKYEFECKQCGEVEIVEAVTGSEATVPTCPECGEPMVRVWFTKFHLIGSGWTRRPNDEIPSMDLPDVPDNHRSKRMERSE